LAYFVVNRFLSTAHRQAVPHIRCKRRGCDQGENEYCLTAKGAKSAKEKSQITAKAEIERFAALVVNAMLKSHCPRIVIQASEPQVNVDEPAHPVLFILHPSSFILSAWSFILQPSAFPLA
jgi:hypothetical protein